MVYSLPRPAAVAPDDTTGTCSTNIFGAIPNSRGCTADAVKQALVYYAGLIFDELKKPTPGPKSPPMIDILRQSKSQYAAPSCPKELFPENYLLGAWDK